MQGVGRQEVECSRMMVFQVIDELVIVPPRYCLLLRREEVSCVKCLSTLSSDDLFLDGA